MGASGKKQPMEVACSLDLRDQKENQNQIENHACLAPVGSATAPLRTASDNAYCLQQY